MRSDLRTVIMFAVTAYDRTDRRLTVTNVMRFDGYHHTNVPSTVSDEYTHVNAGVSAYRFIAMIVDR
jgi:hypothetical protein